MDKVEHITTNLSHAEFLKFEEKKLIGDNDMNETNINDKYGKWLDNYEWDYFTTFTTRKPITMSSARRLMEDYATRMGCSGDRYGYLPNEWKHCRKTKHHNRTEYEYFSDKYVPVVNECKSDGTTRLFWAAEPFEIKDGEFDSKAIDPEFEQFLGYRNSTRYHIHALFKTKYSFDNVRSYWNKKYGRIDLKNYDSGMSGAEYITKYVTKRISDYGFHS